MVVWCIIKVQRIHCTALYSEKCQD